MIKANVQELKSRFPFYIKKLEKGFKIILCYRNKEIATISPKIEEIEETINQSQKKIKREPPGSLKHLIRDFDADKFNKTDPELIEEFYKS